MSNAGAWEGLRVLRRCHQPGCSRNTRLYISVCHWACHEFKDADFENGLEDLKAVQRNSSLHHRYLDLCVRCYQHEAHHPAGRCLLALTRFLPGSG
jgi:hypothetical protein